MFVFFRVLQEGYLNGNNSGAVGQKKPTLAIYRPPSMYDKICCFLLTFFKCIYNTRTCNTRTYDTRVEQRTVCKINVFLNTILVWFLNLNSCSVRLFVTSNK